MHILVTGVNGLLGQNIVTEFAVDHKISGMDMTPWIRPDYPGIRLVQLDLTRLSELRDNMKVLGPEAVIHTAAYTAVDKAEVEPDLAFSINMSVPAELAIICNEMDIPLVHISTDYVFNGKSGPYRESDSCDPQGIYAESKYAGEQAVLKHGAKVAVIRPNVMYGHGYHLKSSFVEWLIKELKEGRPVNIVDDQFNNPSYARRLASVIRKIIEKEAWGIWHFGSKEVVSRYSFALQVADNFGLPTNLINAISTGALNQMAPRPMQSGLICEKLQNELGIQILSIGEELGLLKEEMNVS